MAVRSGGQAPYAPPQTVFALIQAFRNRPLPTPFTREVYVRAGVPESLVTRTSQTFRLLDLVDEAGNPTPEFEGLRRVGSSEFPQRLEAIVRAAYADAFQFVDPAKDSLEKVRDVFRHYEPLGQLTRIVTLFMALCEAAGIVPEGTRKQAPKATAARPNGKARSGAGRGATNAPRAVGGRAARSDDEPGWALDIPPLIRGMLASLPSAEKGWTQVERDKFTKMFGSVLDFAIPIRDASASLEDDDEE
jgi:hypothetical protein